MDVKSLYTVIPHRDGFNNFSFDGEHYQPEISGVAMGTKMGPSYPNLFVGYVEQQTFKQYT